MKFAVVVTLYFPKEDVFFKIEEYSQVFDIVYVFDNTNKANKNRDRLSNIRNIVYLTQNANKGLSYAFNYIICNFSKNFDFLCTMDQDSVFTKENINMIKNFILSHNLIDVGIVAPKIIYAHREKSNKNSSEEYKYVNWVITSGSFLNIKLLKKKKIIFDQNYFIDRLDRDICKQIELNDLKIIQLQTSLLYQELGEKKWIFSVHNSERHYYIFRNRLYFNRKYFPKLKRYLLNSLQSIKHIVCILLFEEKKIEKIVMISKAIKDYRKCINDNL